jgi:RNA polymerase sigma-70 factor (ECF subfamily)
MAERFSEDRVMQIYRDTVGALYTFASRRCGGDRALAEDITQEAWLRGVREWSANGIPDQPLAWLTTVARNLVFDLHRQQESREQVPLEAGSSADLFMALEQEAVAESAELAAAVNRALARMPPEEAALIESFHFERCQVAALATNHGVSVRTIERRLHHARERLRQELSPMLRLTGVII